MQHIYWIKNGILAGRCGPALNPWEPEAFFENRIRGIISLDDEGVEEAALQAAGLDHLPAYRPMTLLECEASRSIFLDCLPPIFDFIDRKRQQNEAVLVHCYYGCDRTGTVLACYLVAREGLGAEEAIERVRQVQPRAMLATGYREAVELFETLVK